MRKFVLATLAALAIGTAAFAQPAEARCCGMDTLGIAQVDRIPGGGVIIILIGVTTGGAMAPIGTPLGIADQ